MRATECRQVVVIVGGFVRARIASHGPIDFHFTLPALKALIALQMWRLCCGRISSPDLNSRWFGLPIEHGGDKAREFGAHV